MINKLLILSTCLLFWGCSSTGRFAYLEGDNSTSWKCGVHKDLYSTVGKVPIYKCECDSLSIAIFSSQSENQLFAPPYELGVRTISMGPLWFPIIPNPFYVIRELFVPFSCRYVMWFEIVSHNKSLTIDSSTIKFSQITGNAINPSTTFLCIKDGAYRFKKESAFPPTRFLNDTLCVYFIFDLKKEDIKGINIDCRSLSSDIPLLKTIYHSEWFYDFFSLHDMLMR